MNLLRWNDDRLDGWLADYKTLEKTVDHIDDLARDTARDVTEMKNTRAAAITARQWWLMLTVTLFSNPLTALVVYALTSKGK